MRTSRYLAGTLFAVMAIVGSAGPALAHNNSQSNAGAARDVVVTLEQSGTQVPVAGFIGPVREQVGDAIYLRAHSGMECGAKSSPNIGSLEGNPEFPPFACPSPVK